MRAVACEILYCMRYFTENRSYCKGLGESRTGTLNVQGRFLREEQIKAQSWSQISLSLSKQLKPKTLKNMRTSKTKITVINLSGE